MRDDLKQLSNGRLWWETAVGFVVALVGAGIIALPVWRGDEVSVVLMLVGLVLVGGGCTWINKRRAASLVDGAVRLIKAWKWGNGKE